MGKVKYLIAVLACLFFVRLDVQAEAGVATGSVADNNLTTCVSEEIISICESVGYWYGVSPDLIIALIEHESRGIPDATNGKYIGLMQISSDYTMPGCIYEGYDLFKPVDNIFCGTEYLFRLFEQYEEPSLVLDLYGGYGKELYECGEMSSFSEYVLDRAIVIEKIRRLRWRNLK